MTDPRTREAPSSATDIVREALARLREGTPAPADEEAIVRLFAAWEREHRAALDSLTRAADRPDPAAIDEEETPSALRERLAEYRGRRDGFSKAIALTLGHEAAARIEAEARRRLAEETPPR